MILASLLFALVAADHRPYEFIRADRTADEVAPWIDFESETGWTGSATRGTVSVARSQEHQLFGRWTLAVSVNAAEARIRPGAPMTLPSDDFTSCGVWIRGIRGQYGSRQPNYPILDLVFVDTMGRETLVPMMPAIWDSPQRVRWTEWHWVVKRFTAEERTRLTGLAFNGFRLTEAENAAAQTFYFDNVSFFRDDIAGTLDYELPDPKTPLRKKMRAFADGISVEKAMARRAANPGVDSLDHGNWSPYPREGAVPVFDSDVKGPTGANAIHIRAVGDKLYLSNVLDRPPHVLKPNTRYRFSCFLKAKDVRPTGRKGGIYIEVNNGPDNWAESNKTRIVGTTDWMYHGMEFKTSGEIVEKPYVVLRILNATGEAWFDGVRLEEVK